MGLDFNNAHVQPTGEYHYHGISDMLVDAYESGDDLVQIGFAADGYLIYYSKSCAYASSYALADTTRTGADCVGTIGPDSLSVDIDGTAPDGTYTEDYVFDASNGDLDECNGVEIDGEYAYRITDEFPYAPRCLFGEPSEDAGVGGPGGGAPPDGAAGPEGAGGPGADQPADG